MSESETRNTNWGYRHSNNISNFREGYNINYMETTRDLVEVSKYLARYRSENNYIECSNWLLKSKLFAVLLIMLERHT